ncbi:MAG: hypothetical protein WBV82_32935 [Myxococcaceae bacterium]
MARPAKNALTSLNLPPNLSAWAESLGEALGRGVARGINSGLSTLSNTLQPNVVSTGRRGRPPKLPAFPVPSERRCQEQGCVREARSKGLCSAHYQAERRKILLKAQAKG